LTDISHNAKELDRLEKDPEMQHKILSFIRKKITKTAMKYKKKINDSVNIIFNNDKYTVSEFVDAFKLVNDILFSIGAHFADLYTLLRVFKTFNLSEMKQKAYSEATDQPDKAHNIIIYAGDAHSQTYRKFLEDVLHFDKIEVAGKEEPYGRAGELMYCIDMEPITQPLFSKYHELDSATDLIKPLVKAQQSESIL
jgi:sulfite reductase alpha subunit-like flavoprotein